jgi:ribosomal protein L6P/L9E
MKFKNSINLFDVSLFRYDNFVIFLSSKGRVVLDMSKNINDLRCFLSSSSLRIDKTFSSESKIESVLNGLRTFYIKKLSLVGIGFRAWSYFDNDKNCQILSIKVGLSRDVLISIPSDVIILCLKPTLILIKGVDKDAVSLLACQIRSIKTPDVYKGKGIRYENEIVNIKPGKQK